MAESQPSKTSGATGERGCEVCGGSRTVENWSYYHSNRLPCPKCQSTSARQLADARIAAKSSEVPPPIRVAIVKWPPYDPGPGYSVAWRDPVTNIGGVRGGSLHLEAAIFLAKRIRDRRERVV